MLFDPSEMPTGTFLNEARAQVRSRGAEHRHILFGWTASTLVHLGLASGAAVWLLLGYWSLIDTVRLSGSREVISLELTMTDNKVSLPATAATAATPVSLTVREDVEEFTLESLSDMTPQAMDVKREQSRARVRPHDAIDQLLAEVLPSKTAVSNLNAPARSSPTAKSLQPIVPPAVANGGQQRPSVAALPKTTIGFEETAARPIHNPKPTYPTEAIRLGITGRVVLKVTVSEAGTVASIAIASSSGHYLLDHAAIAGVSRWQFVAATRGGRPISSTFRQPIRFAPRT